MFGFKKSRKDENTPSAIKTGAPEKEKKAGFFSTISLGLKKTRQHFSNNLANLFLGKKVIDDALLEEIETLLLTSDIGVQATQKIIGDITGKIKRKELDNPQALFEALKAELEAILLPCSKPLNHLDQHKPFVLLMVGVNGSGKTTTIGKLTQYFKQMGKSVLLAAGDTFRAAAIEQLQAWGERNNIPVIAQQTGSDSASVIYDAIAAAKARNIDIVIADTAGRLHTQTNLMEELKKIKRVITKADATAPHEVMLVLDAGNGQNALRQAQQFHEAVQITGLTITKLDGTAKGGVIFNLAQQLKLPIRFVGLGESIDALQVFDAKTFVEALFEEKIAADQGQN
jgi:fused signal recognition particle receptor